MAAIVAHGRRQRQYRLFLNPIGNMDDYRIIGRFRLSSLMILELLRIIGPSLERPSKRSHALSPLQHIFVALPFYATGSFQWVIGDLIRVSTASVSRCIRAVSKAIRKLVDNIAFPNTPQQIRQEKVNFYNMIGFPNVGCIDGTLIPIKMPINDERSFVGRKNGHSLNVQVVCDSKMRFINIIARYPGRSHDSHIFNNSKLETDFENGVYGESGLLGDSGYACRPYLLTPKLNPKTDADKRYNFAHCGTRYTIERTSGVLKSRFRCLHKTRWVLNYESEECVNIIVACAKLMCRDHGLPDPDVSYSEDSDTDDDYNFDLGIFCLLGIKFVRA